MKNKKLGIIFVLGLWFALAFLLRIYRIGHLGLYADETNGNYWMSYIILKPITNIQLLWQKAIFSTFTPSWLIGYSPLSARLYSVIFSSLITIAIFFFSIKVIKFSRSLAVALTSAFLVAILPWNFMIARIGHTQIPIIILLSLIHVGLFLNAKSLKQYTISLIPLCISLFYYQSMIIVAGSAGLLTAIYIYLGVDKKIRSKSLIIFATLFSAVFLVVNQQYNFLSVASRGMDLAIWRDVNTTWETDKFRGLSWNSSPSLFSFNLQPEQLANKLFFNKVVSNLSIFTKNYLSFFTPDWLFMKGDPILRHSTGMVGAFYPFLLPFMIYGAFKFFSTAEKKARVTFLVWILVSPIPAAITKDGAGYLLRVITMLPFLTYFCALGIVESFNLVKKNWRIPYGIILSLLAIYSAYYFFYGYFHVYPYLSERSFENGFEKLSDFQVKENNSPMLVLWDGYYHNGDFRFWQKTPFDQYENFKLKQLVYGETTVWQTFPNLYFTNPKSVLDIQKFLKDNPVRYIVLPDRYFLKYPEDIKIILSVNPIEEIQYPDKTTALSIYTIK